MIPIGKSPFPEAPLRGERRGEERRGERMGGEEWTEEERGEHKNYKMIVQTDLSCNEACLRF